MGINDKTRVVHYSFEPEPGQGEIDQSLLNVEETLKKALDKGIITLYDDGRDCCPWFEGKPSKELRALKDTFAKAKRHPAPTNDPYYYCPWKEPSRKNDNGKAS